METILKNIQTKISEVEAVKYTDEDWGQLDFYGKDIPVQFPCVIFDLKTGEFENIGKDRTQIPAERQIGRFTLEINLANIKLSNTSGKSPLSQKNNAWNIHNIIADLHAQLQGFSAAENCGKLNRKSYLRVRRDDGVQQFRILYDFEVANI